MIFAGTRVADGDGWGVVIETGNDCQIYRINRELRKKTTRVQRMITRVCLVNLYMMLFLALFASLVIYYKMETSTSAATPTPTLSMSMSTSTLPLGGPAPPTWTRLWPLLRRMILLFNTMVPLSLQFFFEMASLILSRHRVVVNRNGTLAFQADPRHIVSDKTGTMTTNRLELHGIYEHRWERANATTLATHTLLASCSRGHSRGFDRCRSISIRIIKILIRAAKWKMRQPQPARCHPSQSQRRNVAFAASARATTEWQ